MIDPEDYRVPPLNWSQVDGKADWLRGALRMTDTPYIDVVRVVETIICNQLELSEFQVWSKAAMGDCEGQTCPQGTFIRFREDVYEKACNDDYRARFTFAHELGHFLLHQNAPMARASRTDGTPAYMLAEPQANRFAATLLMPKLHIFSGDEASDLKSRFGVSWDAASHRLSDLKKKCEI